jgi:hypothetical protein
MIEFAAIRESCTTLRSPTTCPRAYAQALDNERHTLIGESRGAQCIGAAHALEEGAGADLAHDEAIQHRLRGAIGRVGHGEPHQHERPIAQSLPRLWLHGIGQALHLRIDRGGLRLRRRNVSRCCRCRESSQELSCDRTKPGHGAKKIIQELVTCMLARHVDCP